MRRRPGIGGLQNAAAARDQYRLLGENVAKLRTDLMKEQLATFRSQLEDFARKHKNDIRKNPAFRSQFHEMCAKVGVDPLASNKGFWAELLGIGDFYYELGVQIVEICLATRSLNGGVISLEELCKLLGQTRKGTREAISQDDCLRAISKLKVLGNGFEVISLGKKKLVRSVPTELNKDHNEVLELAQGQGFVTVDEVERSELSSPSPLHDEDEPVPTVQHYEVGQPQASYQYEVDQAHHVYQYELEQPYHYSYEVESPSNVHRYDESQPHYQYYHY